MIRGGLETQLWTNTVGSQNNWSSWGEVDADSQKELASVSAQVSPLGFVTEYDTTDIVTTPPLPDLT